MAHTVRYTRTVDDGITVRNHLTTLSGGSKQLISELIPGASTNLLLAMVIDISQLKFVELGCETRAITIKTNSSGSPQETFTLAANEFICWDVDDPTAECPFAGDVTALYITLASGADATLSGVLLTDPTA